MNTKKLFLFMVAACACGTGLAQEPVSKSSVMIGSDGAIKPTNAVPSIRTALFGASPTAPLFLSNNQVRVAVGSTAGTVAAGDDARITNAQSKVTFASPPATSTSAGTQGTIIVSGNYLYICIAANTWMRAQLLSNF